MRVYKSMFLSVLYYYYYYIIDPLVSFHLCLVMLINTIVTSVLNCVVFLLKYAFPTRTDYSSFGGSKDRGRNCAGPLTII